MFYRVAESSTAKLMRFDWSGSQLTIQTLPYRQGDANCTLNLEFLLLLHRFRIFAIYQ